MQDYERDNILEQYEIAVNSTRKTRGAILCSTDKGVFLMRELGVSEKRLPALIELYEYFMDYGYQTIDMPVKNREGKRICLNLPDGAKFLDSREIYYVEIQNRMLHYHTKAGVFTIRGALKDVQEELEDWHFAKCNQCYLVNLKYVSEIRKNIAVVSGDELEISRRNRPAFLSAVVDFLGG